MKLNNKGFAITLVLYGTLVLFLLLIVSLLGILSTYKLRLEKIYPEQETEIGELTCDFTAKYFAPTTEIKVTVNDESLLHDKPYSYWGEWVSNSTHYNNKIASYTIKVRDKYENVVNCGKVYFNSSNVTKYVFTTDILECCEFVKKDDPVYNKTICNAFLGIEGSIQHDTSSDALNDCRNNCPAARRKFVYGCDTKGVTVKKYYIISEKAH